MPSEEKENVQPTDDTYSGDKGGLPSVHGQPCINRCQMGPMRPPMLCYDHISVGNRVRFAHDLLWHSITDVS
jgi:hypothetical protein